MSHTQKHSGIGNEDSYTQEFFNELYGRLNLEGKSAKTELRRATILSAQAYMRFYADYQRQLPPYEMKKEIEKALNNIDKATKSLVKVYVSSDYSEEIMSNFVHIISEKYPSLSGVIPQIQNTNQFMTTSSPMRSLDFLGATADALERTLKNYNPPKASPRSVALYHWLMIISAPLEKIMGRKLEQAHYYEGEYISKKKIGDSELLLLIIQKLDPHITISQIETALKDSRKERHDAPWDNYF